MIKNNRIETLDYLRGLMALSIMFYHLRSFIGILDDSSDILGRFGIYAVSIFFILSGLSMAIVYNSFIVDIITSLKFIIRRIFRIWPLLWIVCFLTILPLMIHGEFSWKMVLLNITTLFGFIKPYDYIATGSWSIGNEMVYYSLTPLIIFLYNKDVRIGNIFTVITIALGAYYSFVLLTPNKILSEQWKIYINPFSNLFLYSMGIAIYYNLNKYKFNQILNFIGLVIFAGLFCLVPFKGDGINIVTGGGRIIFVIISLFIVIFFYKISFRLPAFISKLLEMFGLATYGVYLLHPVLYSYLKLALNKLNIFSNSILFISTIVLTILLSTLSYYIFERKLIKLGKKLSDLLPIKVAGKKIAGNLISKPL